MSHDEPSNNPRPARVLALCPDWQQPTGGVRKLYRHVDVLNAHGVSAAIVHQQPGFRCRWFANDTRVVYHPDVWPPTGDDVLLVPEQVAWQLTAGTPGVRKVVFNQNAYRTFVGQEAAGVPGVPPYRHPDFRATIVVSEDNRQYLEYAFPGHPVFRVRHSVDASLFYFEPDKRRQVALMPRKKASDASQVLGILHARGALEGVNVALIAGKSEAEAARVLRESQVFLSLSTQEGFGLPPLEAMACGCTTVGYHGRGGLEFLREPHAVPVEAEDVVGFARAVERVLNQWRADPPPMLEQGRRASQFVAAHYSPEQEERDIVSAWEQILQLP